MVKGAPRVSTGRWHSAYVQARSFIGSRLFFRLTLALFVLQAAIVAVLSGYPLAFDEGTHVGIIQLHAQQLSPFFSNIPDSTGQYGPLATDPSYLYHYILSFPYRLLTLFFSSTFALVVSLRFINIAIFVLGLIVFRKALSYCGASKALVNVVILAFALLPLSSFTAAQINYDNMVFLMVALVFLYGARLTLSVLNTKKLDVKSLVLLATSSLAGAQVKYAFLPILMAVFIWTCLLVAFWVKANRGKLVQQIKIAAKSLNTKTGFALIALMFVIGGLFVARYGYNMSTYKTPVPECDKVLSVQSCMAWGPWARNYQLGQTHVATTSTAQQKAFAKAWVYISGSQLFTVLNSNNNGAMEKPLPKFAGGALFVLTLGAVFMILYWRKAVKGAPVLIFYGFVSFTYLGVLIAKNYSEYMKYGMPIAIQGRYLLIVLLVLMIVMARAYSAAFHKAPHWKLVLLILGVVVGVQGAGAITYLSKSDDSWRWNADATVNISQPIVESKTTAGSAIVNTAEVNRN